MSNIILPARIEYLHSFIEFVADRAEKEGFGEKKIKEIELAMEEALVNIFSYAYPEKAGDVELICSMNNDNGFIIEILDDGIPFNILSLPDPDLNASISDRRIGGLGVYIIRNIVDDLRYRRDGGKNILTFIIHKKKI